MSSIGARRGMLFTTLGLFLMVPAGALNARIQAQTPAPAVVPRFARGPNPIALRGPARPERYMEASGRKAALLGREDGSFEAWVYPLKVLHDFRLSFGTPDYADPIPGINLASSVDVRPEASVVRFAHAAFTVDAVWIVPLNDQGALVLLDVSTSQPLQVVVKFRPDLKPMWPAALGGQYSYWDAGLKAYVLGEASGKQAAMIGSPFGIDPPEQPAHNLPDAPSQFTIKITPETAARGLVPIVIAASLEGLNGAKATYQKLLASSDVMYLESAAHYRRLREEMTSIDSPDDRLDLAFEWGKVALDKGFVCNPHLGCGLIAGLGPSGTSERPGFGWYFGGDAFINSWAMTAYGDFDTVKQSLEFLRKRQRADGKMMHELSQGAGYIKWFEEFPYGYYHADTTPLYIIAVRDYVRASGDVALAKDFWPSMKNAYDYCVSTDEDGDGLMDNTKAGLAAVETGTLRRRDVLTDVFLGAAWAEAADAAAELASFAGDPFATAARAASTKARQSLNARFLDDQGRRIYFAYMKDGKGQAEPTVWPGFGLWRGVFDASRPAVAGALDDLAGAGVGADWGARMLSIDSALYGPLSYNNGASWPFLTGFAALALYSNGRPDAAWTYLDGTADLTFLESRGYMAELFSGDRLRSIDAAVPHQLFATTGFVSTLMRGLVGLNVLPAGTRDGRQLPERLVLAPQLPAGWGYLRIHNLRWRGVTADVNVTRDESGLSISIAPRVRWTSTGDTLTPDARSLPIEIRASLPPGTSLAKGAVGAGAWHAEAPASGPNRGPRLWRFSDVLKPVLFDIPYAPGIEVAPVQDPLQLGDLSSRLRIIDAWLDGTTYTLKVEGRRGRSYQVRMLMPYRMTIDGARVVQNLGARPPAVSPIRLVAIDMPPADPAASGAVHKRSDWATATVTVHLGERLR
jgi:glycogen debranching enzyme